jgi:ketosteroid isomerase-like protein
MDASSFDRSSGAGYIAGRQAWHSNFVIDQGETHMAGNEQMIIELDKQRMTAMAQKDVAALKNIICKGLVYTHSSGRQDTKESLLDGMESGSTVYTSMVPSEVKAQDLGNAVVLTGVAAISVDSKGKSNSFRVRFTDVYENQNGTWRMITWQSTKLPE